MFLTKKNLTDWASAHPDKVQILPAGIYQPYQIKNKYGAQLELPEQYHIIIVDDSQLRNNQKHF